MTLTKEEFRGLLIDVASKKAKTTTSFSIQSLTLDIGEEIWPIIEDALTKASHAGGRKALSDASIYLSAISSKMWAVDFCDRLINYRDTKYPEAKIIRLSDGAVIRYVKGRKDCGTGDHMYLAEWSRDDWAPTDNWLELLHDTNTGEDFEKLKKFATEILQS
jgi:hypothetical protein